MLKRKSGLHKLMSIVQRKSMKLESEFFNPSEEPKCQECTPYTIENDMKKMVSGKAATEATVLSMGSLELLLRASVFTVLDLNEKGSTTLPREVQGAITHHLRYSYNKVLRMGGCLTRMLLNSQKLMTCTLLCASSCAS